MTRTPKTTQKSKAKKTTSSARRASATKKTSEAPVKETSADDDSAKESSEKKSPTGADAPPPPPPPATSTGPSSSSGNSGPWLGVFIALIFLSALGAGIFVTRDIWWMYAEPYLPSSAPREDPRVAVLMERLGALETKVNSEVPEKDMTNSTFQELQQARDRLSKELATVMQRLETVENSMEAVERMAVAVGSETDSGDAQESLRVLVDRVSTLEQAANASDLNSRLDSLEEQNRTVDDTLSSKVALLEDVKRRMESLEAQRSRNADSVDPGVSALILAVGQLREAVRLGHAYRAELDSMKSVMPDRIGAIPDVSRNIDVLESFAGTGIANQAMLREMFPDVSRAALQADRRIDGDGWFSEAVNRLGNLITVRRVDDAAADTVDARLAAAETYLATDDLAAVIHALSGLAGPGADAIAPWLEKVQATLAAEQALRKLNSVAIAQLSAVQE